MGLGLNTILGKAVISVTFPLVTDSTSEHAHNVAVVITIPEEGSPSRPQYYKPEQKLEFMTSKAHLREFMKNLDIFL